MFEIGDYGDSEVQGEVANSLAIMTLNRPGTLNSLSLDMIRLISIQLEEWENSASVRAILIRGAGGRAFCAGGDVKAAYYAGLPYRDGESAELPACMFFEEEYALNRQMFACRKPLIAWMDGVVMGGGFGLAGACSYRVATEQTAFAMPEVGIGLFPDVGSAYYLTRMPGYTGYYLALTGNPVGMADALYTGAASHAVPSGLYGRIVSDLRRSIPRTRNVRSAIIDHLVRQGGGIVVPKAALSENRRRIDKCFSAGSVEEIMQRLSADGSDFAAETLSVLYKRSPISLKVTFRHLREAEGMDFDTVTRRDYGLACRFLEEHDFYEGVRAALIDRDKTPRWEPDRLNDVDDEMIDTYFEGLPVPAAGLA